MIKELLGTQDCNDLALPQENVLRIIASMMEFDMKDEQIRVHIPEHLRWFVNDRFGMFIHWGLYSLPARHEWVQTHEELSDTRYHRYFERFNPDLYDPERWARLAARAGMRYVVMTAKHHEGFCLWDSEYTDFKAPNTPFGRDALGPAVEAFRREGLRVGFYYSLLDWHHPDFLIDPLHPQRNVSDIEDRNRTRSMARYREYMTNQVTELLTRFGDIDILWFDFSYGDWEFPDRAGLRGKGKDDWGAEELINTVRSLRPGIVLNDRLGIPGDFVTPEQHQPEHWPNRDGAPVVWEACHTFSGSWGYHRDEESWKSGEQLIRLLVESVSRGGNLLMNVGPTGRGTLDERTLEALDVYARWMELHDRAIYGCTQSIYPEPSGVRYTQKGSVLYAHLLSWPFRHLHLPGLAGNVKYIQLLKDASELPFQEPSDSKSPQEQRPDVPAGSVTVELPVKKPAGVVPVLEIFLKE